MVREFPETYQGRDAAHIGLAGARIEEAESGEEIHGPAGKFLELDHGTLVRARFAEHPAIHFGHLVAANDEGIGVIGSDRPGLGLRQAKRRLGRRLSRQGGFIGTRVGNFEWQPEAGEQFAAVR